MSIETDVSLILPAFNEAAKIRSTIEEAGDYFSTRGLASEIIVAADGDDGTREIALELAAKDPRLRVFGDRLRLGKGRGVRLAVKMASGAVIGYADADNKVPIDELDRILPRLSSADVVVGSRALSQSKIIRRQPLYRRAGSWGFGLTMRMLTGLYEISDTQCGFKFFTQSAAKTIFQHQRVDGYMFDVEILLIAQRLGYRIEEVPVSWRDDGDSRLQLVSGNIRNVRDLLRIRRALRSFDEYSAVAAKRAAQG
jgi:glycosyltransferase involved in cell wall biosynthesis